MILNLQIMGKLRSLLATAAGGLALAGCEAGANEKSKDPETAEFTKLATIVETTKVTREQCIALMPNKEEVKACMLKLGEQKKNEIAALDKSIESEKALGQELDTTNEVLSKLNEVAREEFEREKHPQN